MGISAKRAVTTIAAAALLVVGIDYATFAATGDSFVLGQMNKAESTTTLSRTDPGPALRLTTRSDKAAPLSVNGEGKVVNLNADRVDGRHAKTLATHAITYQAGKRGQTISPAGLWSTPVKSGLYEISFSAMLWDQTNPGPANFVCGVLDLDTFGTNNQLIYAVSSAAYFGGTNGGPPAAVSGVGTVRINSGASTGVVCFPETGTFQFFKPLKVTFTKINSRENRTAKVAPLPMGAKPGSSFFGR